MKSRYPYELPPHPVKYGVQLPVKSLLIDPQTQRTLNERRAQSIADNLVREAIGSIVVSRRESGEDFIVDGMHRHRVCGLVGIEEMTCEVHMGLSQQQEAVLFLIKNREASKPNALDEYKVGLTAGLPLFVDTDTALRKRNLEVGTTSANSIGAVAGILRITAEYGPDILDRTLTVAEQAWGRTAQTWDGMLLGGIGMFLGRHGADIKDSDLARKIQKRGTAGLWISRVHTIATTGGMHNSGTGSRVSTAYQCVKQEWNKGRRKNLIPA